jgi:putative transposase
MPDQMHICVEIPPKPCVASVIGFIKGKSAIAIARQLLGKEMHVAAVHFQAKAFTVSTNVRLEAFATGLSGFI